MRKLNKERYPEKWEKLKQQYGEQQAEILYSKYCRSFCLEKYIYKKAS